MEEKKIKRKVVPITTFYKAANYKDIEPGSVLLGLGAGKLWRAIDSTEDYLQVAPYSGGECYTLFTISSQAEFGLIEHPEDLPERISL